MTDDDFQRKAEFLLNQQAQSEARLGRLEDIVTRLADASLRRITRLEDSMTALVDAQVRYEDKMTVLAETMTGLAQAQTHTDQKLNALIDIVREGREGGSAR